MRVDLEQISYGTITDQGQVREENQDAIGFFRTDDGRWMFLLVCDGMGGHAGGRTASTLAVDAISRGLMEELAGEQSPEEAIAAAIRRANTEVYERSQKELELRGMGTTCALIALRSDGLCWLAHVGDSRIFYILPGKIEQKTRDHTTVQRLVDGGLIDAKDAETHPDAGLLSRCIGVKPQVEPEVQGPFELHEGDRFLACSDGLTNEVDPKEIGAMLLAFEPMDALKRLVMLANERGGKDNISIVACYIPGKHPPTGKFIPKAMTLTTPPLLTAGRLPTTPPPASEPSPPAVQEAISKPQKLHPSPLVFENAQESHPTRERFWTKQQLMVLVPLLLLTFVLGFLGGYILRDWPCASVERDCCKQCQHQGKFGETGKNLNPRPSTNPMGTRDIKPEEAPPAEKPDEGSPENASTQESMTEGSPENASMQGSMTPDMQNPASNGKKDSGKTQSKLGPETKQTKPKSHTTPSAPKKNISK